MSGPDGTRRGIKTQLNKIVLIPAITFLVLFVVLSVATVTQALVLRAAAAKSEEGSRLYAALVELQAERELALQYLADPSPEVLGLLRTQQAGTDEALAEIRLTEDDLAEADFRSALNQRETLRKDIAARRINRSEAHRGYSAIIAAGIDHYAIHSRKFGDGEAVATGGAFVQTMRTQETFAQADALIAGAQVAGELTEAERIMFSGLINELERRLNELRWALSEPAARYYAALAESTEWESMVASAGQIANWRPTEDPVFGGWSETLPTAVAVWDTDAVRVNETLVAMTEAQAQVTIETTQDASAQVFSTAIGGSILALFAGALAYGIASKTATRLTGRLSQLRQDTLDLARNELPDIVRRLEQGEEVDLQTQPRRLDYGNDEIGQVADAFNTAQRTAVAAAARQVEIRSGANRVFLALAYRDQSLLQRQLRLIDQIERQEEDPDLMDRLFQLDHLATRGRRNAENLIILAGGQPGRRWRSPIPLIDVLRSAVSETEDYARITVLPTPDVALLGQGVADVIHLFAELVENAARYSPPHTRVEVYSERVSKGVAVEVRDQGLGMSEESLAEANNLLAHPPEFDVVALGENVRLGLFVVARLAARHNIQVRLRSGPDGGTQAIVLIPDTLVVETPPDDLDLGSYEAERDNRSSASRTAPPAPPAVPAAPPVPEPASPAGTVSRDPNDPRPPLPKRQRQTHLAAPLRDAGAPDPSATQPAATPRRSSEEARRMMEAFHRGTRKGRESRATRSPESVTE